MPSIIFINYGGNTLSKFCGLGQAGFPAKILICRQIRGFPLILRPPRYQRCSLITT